MPKTTFFNDHAECIQDAYAKKLARQPITDAKQQNALNHALQATLAALNQGKLRVATPMGKHQWQVKDWVKQALMLYLNREPCRVMQSGGQTAYDKVPMKYQHDQAEDFAAHQVRVVPNATVRFGAYVGPHVVLMPCFINLGAYVDEGCMIDTWATVGSCAQIGKNVHISGGAGIGGVLEPIQAQPTIIEDNCFIGARSEIAEGVIVERGSVIAAGVYLTQSCKIFDRDSQSLLPPGRIPAGSVVVPGSLPVTDGSCHQYAAIITKRVDEQTLSKTSLNDLLRDKEPQSS
jgi:2,3,4,5-tetrahydropyridine-2,6-dicarboxylate N-succinyltransferase